MSERFITHCTKQILRNSKKKIQEMKLLRTLVSLLLFALIEKVRLKILENKEKEKSSQG